MVKWTSVHGEEGFAFSLRSTCKYFLLVSKEPGMNLLLVVTL